MRLSRLTLLPAALLALGLGACAPQATNSTVSSGSLGSVASLEYGTIVGMRPVNVQNAPTGIGGVGGGVAGGLLGSTIGGDWRANVVGGVLGAAVGALAGSAVEGSLGRGQAVEFVVRMDRGQRDAAIIQTNEDGFQVGERVAVSFGGDRARLMRAR